MTIGLMLWMWLVLAIPLAIVVEMLMNPKGNDRDDRELHRPYRAVNRQSEQRS